MNLFETSDHSVCNDADGMRAARSLSASWRRLRGATATVLSVAVLAGATVAGAATTTFGVLLDTDNNASSGCAINTADGSFAGVETVLSTTVVADSSGYRVTSRTLQTCTGSGLSTPVVLDSTAFPVARGYGVNGASAVETYIPVIFLPRTGLKMRLGLTTVGADGVTGADAVLSNNGATILLDAPLPIVVPALSTLALGLTALLLAIAVWYARRRGWHGIQLVVVAVFAISLSGQIIAAIVRDGLITDWSGVPALATDPLGDAPSGTDMSAFYATYDGQDLYFRIDTVLNSPPVANAQSVTAKVGETLPITLTGADYENSPLTFTVLTQPAQGVLAGTAPNVTYTANANASASDSFTFKVNDGALDSATATISIANTRAPAITSANSALFIPGQANTFAIASNGMPTPTASITGCSPALPASITFTADSNGGGTLAGNPTAAQAGNYVCTVSSINGITPNATQAFTLQVGAAPTFTSATTINAIEGQVLNFAPTVNAAPAVTSFTQSGTLPSAVSFAWTSGNTASLTSTPAICTRGSYPISFAAANGVPPNATQNATLVVAAVNQAPSFTAGAAVTVLEDSGAYAQPWATAVSAGPSCESTQTLSFQLTGNSNTALFSTQPAISPSGQLTFTPAANANGSATITVRVQDNGGTANGGTDTSTPSTLTINVTPVNDAPSFTKGFDVTVSQNAPAQSVAGWATAISAGPADEAGQSLSFQVTGNTNPAMFSAAPAITASGTLTFTPAIDQPGTAAITVVLKDSGGTANGGADTSAPQTFNITVTFVNQAPSFMKGADQTVLEDAGAQSVANWATAISAGPPSESGQTVVIQVGANTNPTLFAVAPAVSPTGTLTYTPAANACGAATITLRAQDNGGVDRGGVDTSPTQTFVITVVCVNDAPSFIAGSTPVTVAANSGAYDQPWASGISMGPANEAGQTAAFIVSNVSNLGLFSAAPVVTAAGRLQFIPATNTGGTSTFDVRLQDNGGTANGGVDTSGTVTVTINVNQAVQAANDSYSTPMGTIFNSLPFSGGTGPSALANDTLGFPVSAPTGISNLKVVGWKAGTPVNVTNAGPVATSTFWGFPVPVSDGLVALFHPTAPGGVSLTPPANFWGYVEFDYTLSNGATSSTATVHIDVTKAPVATADSGYLGLTTAINVAAPGLLGNDDLGWQLATLVSYGGGSLGGTVDDHAAGSTTPFVAAGGRALQVNADGSFSLGAGPVLTSTVTFDYKIQNASGTSTGTVTITAPTPPSVTSNPANASVNVGTAATFTAGASGNPTPTVQWQFSTDAGATWSDVVGANSTTLTVTAAVADDGKRYHAVFTNAVGSATSTGATLTVLVPPPTVTTSGGTATFTEDGGAVVVDNGLTLTVAAGQLTGATVQITGNLASAEDLLLFTNTATITGSYTAATGLLTLTGTDSAANYQAALRSVQFGNNSQNPSTLTRTVSFKASNLSGASGAATKAVAIVAINDAPVVTTSVGATSYTEPSGTAAITASSAVAVDPALTVTDVDSANLVGATISISGGDAADVLSFVNTPTITGSFASPTLTLTGTDTVANYQAALRSIRFYNTSHDPLAGNRTVGFQVNDGAAANNLSTVANKTVNLVATNTPPIAKPYTSAQNGKLNAQAGIPIAYAAGTLTGTDAEAGTTVSVNTTPASVCADCSISINANGGFTFTAPPSAAGTDVTFTYTVSDNGTPGAAATSAAASVTFTVAAPAIYFVSSAGSGASSCALDVPCTLTRAVAAIGANVNSHIFIMDNGNYTTPSAIALNNGNGMIGQGVTAESFDALFGITPPAGSTARPTVNLTAPTVHTTVTANTLSHIRGLNLRPVAGANKGITANGKSGIIMTELTINMTTNGATGNALDFTNSSFSYLAGTGGVGGLVVTASTGGGLVASGGGTITVQGTGNTITTTAGTALSVSGTTIAGSGLTFQTINVNGANMGINLSNTGTGGLTVTGNSGGTCGGVVANNTTIATAPTFADCTGGTIQNAATGIRLDSAANISLTRMHVTGTSAHNFGIYATNTTNFMLNRSVIDGSIGATTSGQDAPLVFGKLEVAGNPGINGLSGATNAITDSWISGGIEHNLEIYGQSNNFGLTITRTVIKSNSTTGGADGIQMELQNTAVGRVLVDNSQFDDNKSQAIQAAANGSSAVHFTLRNSRWSKTTQGNEGVVFSNGANGRLFLDVDGNLVPGSPTTGFGGAAIYVGQTPGNATAASALHARIRNNVVTSPQTATNHSVIAFLTSTPGAVAQGLVHVHDNNITQHSTNGTSRGLLVDTPDADTSPNFHATILNNTVAWTDPTNSLHALVVQARQSSTACLNLSGNNANTASGGFDLRVRQVSPAVANLFGAGANAAAVLAANHPAAGVTTELLGTVSLTSTGCTLPTSPSLP